MTLGTGRHQLNNDERLTAALAAGDESAVSGLMSAYGKSLLLYGNSILDDRESAEDVLQEAFIRLWERRRSFRSLIGVRVFMYRTVRNLALDMLKHRRVRQKYDVQASRSLSEDNLSEKLVEEELFGQLHRAIGQLPETAGVIMSMSLAGMDNKAIADKLAISVNTVKTHKQRSMRALRDIIGPTFVLLAAYFPEILR